MRVEHQDEWLFEPFIPYNSVVILESDGLGKSFFAMQLCCSLATGQKFLFPDIKPKQPEKILYITAQETEFRFLQKLNYVGQFYQNDGLENNNFSFIFRFDSNLLISFGPTFFLEKQNDIQGPVVTPTMGVLKDMINRKKPKLIVLDSLISFFGLDERVTRDVYVFLEHLMRIADLSDCSFLLISHSSYAKNFSMLSHTSININQEQDVKTISVKTRSYSDLLSKFPISVKFKNGIWDGIRFSKTSKWARVKK